MVQFHKQGGRSSSAEHWWKLEELTIEAPQSYSTFVTRSLLRGRNYAFKRGTSPTKLAYMRSRSDRGLMSYYGRSVAELRTYCKQRGIGNTEGKKKEDLVAVLEDADENLTFPRFLDLPPELRILVYEYSFDVFNHEWERNAKNALQLRPPPVASVCKLLREETLSLFYAQGKLHIKVSQGADYARNVPTTTMSVLDAKTMRFFDSAPTVMLESVKKLGIRLERGDRWPLAGIAWEVVLPIGNKPYEVLPATTYGHTVPPDAAEMEEALRSMLQGMAPRKTGYRLKLERSDWKLIQSTFRGPSKTETPKPKED